MTEIRWNYPAIRRTLSAVKLSIVVPAYNEEALLGQSLAQIKQAACAIERRGWKTELIVCDNNSTDRTAQIAREAGAQVVFEPVNQIARARNCGARAATGDWLLFIDADSQPSAGLLSDMADEIASGTCLAGGATLRMEGRHVAGSMVVRMWNWSSRIFKLLAGSFIFCDAAVFRQVGGFNEALFAGEELDLCARLKKAARAANRRVVILRRHPLLTSARKLHLYTFREHFRLIFRASVNRRVLNSREACHIWYDGRR